MISPFLFDGDMVTGECVWGEVAPAPNFLEFFTPDADLEIPSALAAEAYGFMLVTDFRIESLFSIAGGASLSCLLPICPLIDVSYFIKGFPC